MNEDRSEIQILATKDSRRGKSWSKRRANLHVCKDQDIFDDLQFADFSFVNVGNNSKKKVEGVGRVCLKLHDYKVRILPDVRYIPDSRVNLISLDGLTLKGYKDVGIWKFCKVFKGGCLGMRERKNTKNIYHLDDHSLKKDLEGSKVEGTKKKTVKTEKRVRFSVKTPIAHYTVESLQLFKAPPLVCGCMDLNSLQSSILLNRSSAEILQIFKAPLDMWLLDLESLQVFNSIEQQHNYLKKL
ncbi:hypothetical protein M9H77_07851 [Catharanthus roseus]|uniref:Uncharacterized protein n=1 Tax=Catharanthus roseus TaxID=4058 RepID=A0ACC0BWE6_CATRO|nr:hypothetical protein M9H77_07851 [Catharanthus roseus]